MSVSPTDLFSRTPEFCIMVIHVPRLSWTERSDLENSELTCQTVIAFFGGMHRYIYTVLKSINWYYTVLRSITLPFSRFSKAASTAA
jgi:hypothetical protein